MKGPGTLILGSDVVIGMKVIAQTLAPDAVIEIGPGCFVNGTCRASARRIAVGDRGIGGNARIMDTDFHSVRANRHDPGAKVRVAEVVLEESVWIGAWSGLLPGTRIGKNSVVGYGAVCSGEYPADAVIAGNPARVFGSVGEGDREGGR